MMEIEIPQPVKTCQPPAPVPPSFMNQIDVIIQNKRLVDSGQVERTTNARTVIINDVCKLSVLCNPSTKILEERPDTRGKKLFYDLLVYDSKRHYIEFGDHVAVRTVRQMAGDIIGPVVVTPFVSTRSIQVPVARPIYYFSFFEWEQKYLVIGVTTRVVEIIYYDLPCNTYLAPDDVKLLNAEIKRRAVAWYPAISPAGVYCFPYDAIVSERLFGAERSARHYYLPTTDSVRCFTPILLPTANSAAYIHIPNPAFTFRSRYSTFSQLWARNGQVVYPHNGIVQGQIKPVGRPTTAPIPANYEFVLDVLKIRSTENVTRYGSIELGYKIDHTGPRYGIEVTDSRPLAKLDTITGKLPEFAKCLEDEIEITESDIDQLVKGTINSKFFHLFISPVPLQSTTGTTTGDCAKLSFLK